MNKAYRYFIVIMLLISGFSLTRLFAQSGLEYRRSAVMRGNLVKSVFGNWGVIGQPASKGTRGAWIYDNNGYIGDVSLLVGAEVTEGDQTFHSVVVCPVSRPTKQSEISPSSKQWGFEPIAGYFNEDKEGVALYSDPSSWPPYWPDKMNDSEDPGWPGSWNGFFGKTTTAAEECFFIMDDNNDEEFNVPSFNKWNVAFKPDSTNPARNGLGLQVKVRGMQWQDFLAQDVIFWLYEITNTSTTDYSKVLFGMLVGTYIGVTATEDYREYDDDYSFFDVEKDLTFTADFDDNASRNPRWTGDVGVVGYAFLESPGNHYDGIDNDGDANANPAIPATGPYFAETSFNPRIIQAGDKVVLIDKDYNRTIDSVPAEGKAFKTRMNQKSMYEIEIVPGITELSEGNVLVFGGEEIINPNAYDGIDNDLDGLIDENFYLHYRQIRKTKEGKVLFDKLNPVRYKDYLTGQGVMDLMIDEKRTDGIDNDGDWNPEFDDVGADGLIGTNDRGENDGMPTNNEPNFDDTDVDESDQIGLTSFEYFSPAGEFSMADDEDLWNRLAPGFFEVPASIVNGKPERGEDGDFTYGSGYFPLRAGESQFFSLALVYGQGGGPQVDIVDLLKNRETVQKIYDSDYRFPPAPDKPTISVTPGDGKVTIYWDRKAEKSFDPVLKKYDFQGYKIYKATDHNFNEVFGITDTDGTPISYKPLAQFDFDDGIKGYFRPSAELFQEGRGASFYLGNDSGLEHSFVDYDVENGHRYFYAVVAYDNGDELEDIFPKENDKRIDIDPTGVVTAFQNTAVVTPNAPVSGYTPPENSVQLSKIQADGTGRVFYTVVDESAVTGHKYRVEFLDTAADGVDNNDNWNIRTDDLGSDGIADSEDPDGTEYNGVPDLGEPAIDHKDPEEYFVPITTLYSVRDLTGQTKPFVARDTILVRLPDQHLIEGTITITDSDGSIVPQEKYTIDPVNGKIRGRQVRDLLYGETYYITYQYYPVYRSPYIEKSPWVSETLDSDIFDGVRLAYHNYWTVVIDTTNCVWTNPERAYNSFTFVKVDADFITEKLIGFKHPADYRIEFYNEVADTSLEIKKYYSKAYEVNFKIYNITDKKYIDFLFYDNNRDKKLSEGDELVFIEEGNNDAVLFSWDLYFITTTKPSEPTKSYDFVMGDTLTIKVKKPFRQGDVFEFETVKPSVDKKQAAATLEQVKVVPNPYVVGTAHELPLPPAISSGRGERKIDFIHLPAGAKIYLFTSRGEHIQTLEHDSYIEDGTVSWNLKTKENLDVAAGIYFYVVDSEVGTKRGKIALIK
ncbi:MAG TPA: hypothetical protein PLP19_22070 [bacterium]|nr:hypothetical protein [bacterium]HPN46187.1 hypothetical protein [bacterium]